MNNPQQSSGTWFRVIIYILSVVTTAVLTYYIQNWLDRDNQQQKKEADQRSISIQETQISLLVANQASYQERSTAEAQKNQLATPILSNTSEYAATATAYSLRVAQIDSTSTAIAEKQTNIMISLTSVAINATKQVAVITSKPTSATDISPMVWMSGTASKKYAPHVGEICWGVKVGKFVNRQYSYIAYFPTDSEEIVITNGACERHGRTFDTIIDDLKSNMSHIQWMVVRDYNSVAAMPDTIWWETGVGQESSYAPHAGEICWGKYVGKYRQADVSFIVEFKTDSDQITIFNGKCERYGRTIDAITKDLRADPQLTNIDWIVIDNYNNP